MAVNETVLRRAMRDRLVTLVGYGVQLDRIAYEGRPFVPPPPVDAAGAVQLWLEEYLRVLSEEKSSSGNIESIGEMIYSVCTPVGRQLESADLLAQRITQVLYPSLWLTLGSQSIILERAERRPYRVSARNQLWLSKPVAIRWRTFTPLF
jgi:hypothetical protein